MNEIGLVENTKNVHPPPRKAPLNRGWMLTASNNEMATMPEPCYTMPNLGFRCDMSENKVYEKLDLIAKKTEGIFVSSALVNSDAESSSWVKFQQKYPDMFNIIFEDRARIYQAKASFFRFFYVDKIPKKFESKSEILTEILHSSFVLDIGKDSSRSRNKVIVKDMTYALDTFGDMNTDVKIITIEERKRAFPSSTSTYVPKKLKTKWSKLCLQRYFLGEAERMNNESPLNLSPEFIKDFITKDE